mmetsp:Transcript_5647/g.12278  ORF Transcript_5647/g.12278 Transcript_5647/m.12278 type:complete len:208 (+) Transcript_5647:520-1143(+)
MVPERTSESGAVTIAPSDRRRKAMLLLTPSVTPPCSSSMAVSQTSFSCTTIDSRFRTHAASFSLASSRPQFVGTGTQCILRGAGGRGGNGWTKTPAMWVDSECHTAHVICNSTCFATAVSFGLDAKKSVAPDAVAVTRPNASTAVHIIVLTASRESWSRNAWSLSKRTRLWAHTVRAVVYSPPFDAASLRSSAFDCDWLVGLESTSF